MSFEPGFVALLQTQCPRVFPDYAPGGTALPYITWQHIGGRALRYTDNTADTRQATVQVNVWAATRLEALTLTRAVEEALCATTAFQATPVREPIAANDEDTEARGYIQDFDITAPK